jgi:hypothetical protein
MIPKWQMTALFAALGLLLAAAIYTSPYGHALLTGQCSKWPGPPQCQLGRVRGGSMWRVQ